MPRPGHPYSPEFRAEAVRLLRSSGKTVAELSRELGVSEQTLRRWHGAAADEEGAGLSTGEPSRLQEPDRESRGRRLALNPRRKDQSVRRLARLTADAIDIGIVAVTLPARWAANSLRWYARQKDDSPGKAATGPDGDGPAAAE